MSKSQMSAFGVKDGDNYNGGSLRGEALQQQLESQNQAREEKEKVGLLQWQVAGNIYNACGGTAKRMKSGVYNLFALDGGEPAFAKTELITDELLAFDQGVAKDVLAEIKDFRGKGEIFRKYKFLHRRGYMFFGPPGSGKTCLVNQIINQSLGTDGVAFMCDTNPSLVERALKSFRAVEPDRFIVCLFEDIDAILACYGEAQLLSLLDGENNVDNVLNIATTNYPKRLDRRIVARPRRFDRVIRIGMPSEDMRRAYFEKKMQITDKAELEKFVKLTKDFSFASCADVVISVKCLDKNLEETIETLKLLSDKENLKE